MTGNDARRGQWRLSRIELVNWGTFHGHTRIDVARRGHLFTGPSGSGKSSLLDAIATVLTPQGKITYNAAAQDASARGDDRNLVSYVRGAWSKQPDALDDRAVSAYLRDGAVWSGILLQFDNLDAPPVTLARLFHLRAGSNDSADLRDLALADRGDVDLLDLRPFIASGVDARGLKRQRPNAAVTTSGAHKSFFARATRLLGIDSDNALVLLHRTQSAKNLGSLDRLFRDFMLEAPRTFTRAQTAVEQFTDLHEAHRVVKRARAQVEHLQSLEPAIEAYETNLRIGDEARRLLSLLDPFQSRLTIRLASEELAQVRVDEATAVAGRRLVDDRLTSAQASLQAAQQRTTDLGGAVAERAGERLAEARNSAAATAAAWARFAASLTSVGITSAPTDAAGFAQLTGAAGRELAEATALPSLHEHAEQRSYFEALNEAKRLRAEIGELARRRSNVPGQLLKVRRELADFLGVSESAMPFAGELIEVRPAHANWRGAIERVLRPIATTLLVRSDHLPDVRRYVEKRTLGVRLSFEEVPVVFDPARPTRSSASLLHRIDVSTGPFRDWLIGRLSAQFDYDCVHSADELENVPRGVTIGGQVKSGPRKYEKDDRHAVDDRERWVLGGDNEAKVIELRERLRLAEEKHEAAGATLSHAERERNDAARRRQVLSDLLRHEWIEFDREAAHAIVAAREADVQAATEGNGELKDALEREENARSAFQSAVEETTRVGSEVRRLTDTRRRLVELIARTEAETAEHGELADADVAEIESRYRSVQRRLDRTALASVGMKVSNALVGERERAMTVVAQARSTFEHGAQQFRTEFPEASASLVDAIDARADYRGLRESIQTRGLPQYETHFLTLLREKSRDAVGLLLSDLREAPREVRDRIDPVNISLRRSPFDLGRTLHIRVKEQRSSEVTAFISELRTVVDGSWTDDLAEAEERFAVLDRVMRRLSSSSRDDEQWKRRVLDTREHVTFQAQELDSSGAVVNVHDSSAGLSGGQRQKLVIFCLAAALRYQLADTDADLPTYGTIVLDEAFDKADSTYTRMAMDIFEEFGFHMILATPQKLLTTIESYVGAVTAISNETRKQTTVANVVWDRDAAGASATVVQQGGLAEPSNVTGKDI